MLKLHHLLFTFLLLSCTSKESDLKKIFSFPKSLKEVSGIEADTDLNRIWVLQDKGIDAPIFCLDKSGSLVQTIDINNVQNNDWEDLTKDAIGNLLAILKSQALLLVRMEKRLRFSLRLTFGFLPIFLPLISYQEKYAKLISKIFLKKKDCVLQVIPNYLFATKRSIKLVATCMN